MLLPRIDCRLFRSINHSYLPWALNQFTHGFRKKEETNISVITYKVVLDFNHVTQYCPCHNMFANLVHSFHPRTVSFLKPWIYLLAHCGLKNM